MLQVIVNWLATLTSLLFNVFRQHLHFALKISMICVRLLKNEKETTHYNYGLQKYLCKMHLFLEK